MHAAMEPGAISAVHASLLSHGPTGKYPIVERARATSKRRTVMGFGKGALLWLLGIPLPIIIILALFMHH